MNTQVLLDYAKAIVGAIAAAAVTALAGVDWEGVIAAAVAGGASVGATPNGRLPLKRR